MKTKTITPMGSMHPILFFVFIYVVALLVSIFICSSLFYSCNAKPVEKLGKENKTQEQSGNQIQVIAFSQ